MARMRSVKPEFWADEDLAVELSRDARLLYIGLWNLADEHARLRGDPRYIKGQLFAYDDDLTPDVVDRLLDEIAASGRVQRYRVKGRAYLFLPKLARHQRLEAEKVPSRLPGPDESDPDPDSSVRRADKFARRADELIRDEPDTHASRTNGPEPDNPGPVVQPPGGITPAPAPRPVENRENHASPAATVRANSSARRANELSLKHVAGGMEHDGKNIMSEIAERSSDADKSEPEPVRDDVERICNHLADRIENNGAKRPVITKRWRTAARLMLDADGRTEEAVHRAIDWCQNHEFWRANILSMPKLREKYDQLALQARRDRERAPGARRSTTDERVAQAQALKREFRGQPADNEPPLSRLAIPGEVIA